MAVEVSTFDYPALRDDVSRFVRGEHRLFIGGRWVEGASGAQIGVIDPATGSEIARVPAGNEADVDAAVQAARAALESGDWPKMSPADRGKLLWRLADLIEEHGEILGQLESLDNGKPHAAAMDADVPGSASMFRYFAGWADKIEGNLIPLAVTAPDSFHAYTRREPVGVCAQIIPWNYPLMMAAWKLSPALACGCTIVLKPAEQRPLSALYLGRLIEEAGFPPGVVNIVTGYGETAGAALSAHPDVDKIAFTGSTEVGKLIVQAAAGNLKKVSLELGGKSPDIVLSDANLGVAMQGVADAIFYNHGQDCTAGSRLFVQRPVFDDVVSAVAEKAKQITLGPGLDPATDMGPVVSDEQLSRVSGYLADGLQAGARALSGGAGVGGAGYFVQPTVFVDVDPGMRIFREEIFGPVVVCLPFDDLDEVVRLANQTSYGLGAGIWTRDVSKAHTLAARIKAGTVWVNTYGATDPALPFGGYKQSGWGREMGHAALELYTEMKSVMVAL